MRTRREFVVALVMELSRELPGELEWLRSVTVGSRSSDRELVNALVEARDVSVAQVLCEARLVKLHRERGD